MRNLAVLGWVFGLVASACGGDDDKSSGGGTGHVEVKLTDAPGDFEAVPITIARVEAHRSGGGDDAAGGAGGAGGGQDDGDDGAGWVVLVDTPQEHDLLELQNGVQAALGGRDLPAGDYTQIRLVLSKADVVVDGQTHELKVPSGAQTGFKISHNLRVEADTRYALVLDFDARASIKETGHGYQLTPQLRVASFEPIPEEEAPSGGEMAPASQP
jgi:hypothetical protein